MGYDYIKRAYGVNPKVGYRVRHKITNNMGTISRSGRSQQHYVQVRFDGLKHSRPCHPTELEYLAR